MDPIEFLLEVLAKTLNIPKDGVAELVKSEDGKSIKTDAMPLILDKYSAHLKTVKTESMDEGYKKASRIEREKLEKEQKEALGITTDKKGADLALFIKEQAEAGAREAGKEITDDVVKKHPEYLKLERIALSDKQKFEEEKTQAVDAVKKEYQEKETFQTIAEKAMKRTMDRNPILATKPEVAEKIKNAYLKELKESASYSLEGDKINILKDGQNLKDPLGHIVPFEKYADSIADQYFEFKVAADRSSSGAEGGEAGKGKSGEQKLVVPKTKAEFNDAYFKLQDDKSKLELKKAFDEQEAAAGK